MGIPHTHPHSPTLLLHLWPVFKRGHVGLGGGDTENEVAPNYGVTNLKRMTLYE